jgi:hypothetical protein
VKEMFDAVKDVNEFVSASAGVFSRLAVGYQNRLHKGTMDDTDRE